jgi:hypothetical protein
MNKHKLAAIGRILFGLLTVGALIVQLMTSINNGWSIINFFSFFTVESNILAAAMLLSIGVYELVGKSGKQIALLRGAVTLYMTVTGIIYVLLLSGNEVALQTTVPWVNFVLHYLMPVVVLADWLILSPKIRLSLRQTPVWLVFPVIYLIYSLTRGAMTGWYPYPFLDPIVNGWPQVVVMCIFITIAFVIISWLLVLRTKTNKITAAM